MCQSFERPTCDCQVSLVQPYSYVFPIWALFIFKLSSDHLWRLELTRDAENSLLQYESLDLMQFESSQLLIFVA
jgi:hypothetical protein